MKRFTDSELGSIFACKCGACLLSVEERDLHVTMCEKCKPSPGIPVQAALCVLVIGIITAISGAIALWG